METLLNPLMIRGAERLLIVLGAILFAYMGYRLFLNGITDGKGKLSAESKFINLIFTGIGPGLFFMAFGGVILITSVYSHYESNNTGNKNEVILRQEKLDSKLDEYISKLERTKEDISSISETFSAVDFLANEINKKSNKDPVVENKELKEYLSKTLPTFEKERRNYSVEISQQLELLKELKKEIKLIQSMKHVQYQLAPLGEQLDKMLNTLEEIPKSWRKS